MKKVFNFFSDISIFKTVYFNFHYFDFKTAIKFPVFISRNILLKNTSGIIELPNTINTGTIKIGFKSIGVFDHKRSKGIWENKGKVVFTGQAFLGQGTKVSLGIDSKIVFGENLSITGESQIISMKNMTFGNNCLISWDCLIMDTDFHSIYDSSNRIINLPKEVVIGDQVWLGSRCTVLKGSKIPNNCIVGSGSIVTNSLNDSDCVYAGNPVKKIKEGVRWSL